MKHWKTLSVLTVAFALGGFFLWKRLSPAIPSNQAMKEEFSLNDFKMSPRQISRAQGKSFDAVARDPIRPEVAVVADTSAKWLTAERLRSLRLLPRNLTDNECEALAEALCSSPDNPGTFALKNDIMNLLRNQQPPWPALTARLEAIMANENLHTVVRGYAAQHLRYQYEQFGDQEILDAYRKLMDGHPGELAGEVLLAIYSLSQDFPEEIDEAEWRKRAVQCVLAENSNPLARVSALNVAALWGATEILPNACEIAQDTEQPLVLRMAAISAIGHLGSGDELALLKEIAKTSQTLTPAANAAMKTLSLRHGWERQE